MEDIVFENVEGYVMNIQTEFTFIKNITFNNVNSDIFYLMHMSSDKNIQIDGLTFNNVTDVGQSELPLILASSQLESNFVFKNIDIKSTEIINRRAILFLTSTSNSSLEFSDVSVADSVLGGNSNLLGYGIFKDLTFTNIYALNLTSKAEGTNYIISSDYSSEGLAPDNYQTLSNILVEDSSISLLGVSKPDSYVNSTQSFLLSNITYQNSASEVEFDFMRIYQMSTTGSYTITMNDIMFKNLTFTTQSNLMYLQQQLPTPIEISNLEVINVVNAGITVEAFRTNEFYNTTHVSITNMSASNFDGMSGSLFTIFEGADIEIAGSQFSFISNYGKGSVMSAGSQKAVGTFRDCSFWNNTSVDGAVFATEAESNIK